MKMGNSIGICMNFPCEEELPEVYYRVIRVIRTGNKRRSFNFHCIECMKEFFDKMTPT